MTTQQHPDLGGPVQPGADLAGPAQGLPDLAGPAQGPPDLATLPDLAPQPQPDLAPMCVATTGACQPGVTQCCTGICGTTTLGQVCCGETGASCKTLNGEDCCGALECINGVCGLPSKVTLNIDYQVQQTGYWCGPTATHMALSARLNPAPDQAALANELGTTVNGTDWIGQVTQVMNNHLGQGRYATVEMPNDPPTQAQKDKLWSDIVFSIDHGYGMVANIVAPANNHPPGYPNYTIYHYIALVGYDKSNMTVYIADSADFGGNQMYWLTADQVSTLIPPKGYTTLVNP
jgi:hypothetical protein